MPCPRKGFSYRPLRLTWWESDLARPSGTIPERVRVQGLLLWPPQKPPLSCAWRVRAPLPQALP